MPRKKTNTELFERLRALRKAWRLTQKKMAARAGIAVSTYQYYERGERDISSKSLYLLSTYGASAEWLLTGEGEMFQNQIDEDVSFKVDHYLLQQVIEAVEEILAEYNLNLPASKKARLLRVLYQLFDETEKKVSKETVKEYVRLIV